MKTVAFGMQVHIGVDTDWTLVHAVRVRVSGNSANINDMVEGNASLQDEKRSRLCGHGLPASPGASQAKVRWHVAMRPDLHKNLDEADRAHELIDEVNG